MALALKPYRKPPRAAVKMTWIFVNDSDGTPQILVAYLIGDPADRVVDISNVTTDGGVDRGLALSLVTYDVLAGLRLTFLGLKRHVETISAIKLFETGQRNVEVRVQALVTTFREKEKNSVETKTDIMRGSTCPFWSHFHYYLSRDHLLTALG